MNSRYFIYLISSFILLGCKQNTQYILFEDNNFKNYCVTHFDQDGDGEISSSEALNIKSISVITTNISSLKGIESFVNLEELVCSDNSLTQIDVKCFRYLCILNCGDNQIKELDVSHNAELKELVCCNNELSRLNVTNNIFLTLLDCSKNELTSLDVSQNPKLKSLECDYNHLESLDLSNHSNLSTLTCYDNPDLKEIWIRNGHTFKVLNLKNTKAELKYKQ